MSRATTPNMFHNLDVPNLPLRVIKTVINYITPSTHPTMPEFTVQALLAMSVAIVTAGFTWMGGQHPVIQILILCMIGDYLANIYGMTRPEGEKGFWAEFSVNKAMLGIVRKLIIGVLALGLWYVAGLARPYTGPSAEVLALTIIGIGAFTEVMSVLRHLRKGKYEAVDDIEDTIAAAANEYKLRHGLQPPIVVKIETEKPKPDGG